MKNLINKFMESNYVLKGLGNNNKLDVAEALEKWLAEDGEIRRKLYYDIDHEYKREDVITEFYTRGITPTPETIELVLERYEKYLEYNDGWSACLNEAIWDELEEADE